MGGVVGCVVDTGLGLPTSDGLEEVGYSLDIHQDPNVVLVDLREWSLFSKSHLRTALHLSIADFKKVMHSAAETDVLLSKSGLSDIIAHYSVQEAPVLIVFYTQHGSWKDKDMVEAMASHRHRFSPGGARIRVGILQVRWRLRAAPHPPPCWTDVSVLTRRGLQVFLRRKRCV